MALSTRCSRHANEPGPSIGFDCCEIERLRELCAELDEECNDLRARIAEMEAALAAAVDAMRHADLTFAAIIRAHRGEDWIDLETIVAEAQGKLRAALSGEEASDE